STRPLTSSSAPASRVAARRATPASYSVRPLAPLARSWTITRSHRRPDRARTMGAARPPGEASEVMSIKRGATRRLRTGIARPRLDGGRLAALGRVGLRIRRRLASAEHEPRALGFAGVRVALHELLEGRAPRRVVALGPEAFAQRPQSLRRGVFRAVV